MPRRPTLEILCSLVLGLLIRSGCDGEDVRAANQYLAFPSQPHLLPQGTLLVQIYLTTELCSTLEPNIYKDVKGTENINVSFTYNAMIYSEMFICACHPAGCPSSSAANN